MAAISDAVYWIDAGYIVAMTEDEKEDARHRAILKIWENIQSQFEFPIVVKDTKLALALLKEERNFPTFTSVTQLNLFGAGLPFLPNETFNLCSLKSLNLAGNALLDLPPRITRLQQLEVLKLEGNPLKAPQYQKIARILCEFPNLHTFTHHSQLLMDTYDAEKAQSLAICRAWEQIRLEPDQSDDLDCKSFDLQLDKLLNGATPTPSQIREALEMCRKQFPSALTSIRELSLRALRLQTFPPELRCLKMLQELDLSRNLFSEVPKEVYEFKELKTLKLAQNPIPASRHKGIVKELKSALLKIEEVHLPVVPKID